jgi:hypothetical protein
MVDHGPWMGKPNVGSCVGRRKNTFAGKSGFAFTCQNDTSIVLRTKQQEQQPRQRECVMMDATDLARRWISAELPIQRTSFQYTEPPNKVNK